MSSNTAATKMPTNTQPIQRRPVSANAKMEAKSNGNSAISQANGVSGKKGKTGDSG